MQPTQGSTPPTPRRRPPPSRSTTSRLAVATPSPSASGSTPARAAGTSPPARSPTPSGCRPRSSARSARRAAGRAGCAPPAPARSTMEGSATRSARGDGRAARRRHRAPALRRRPRPRAAPGRRPRAPRHHAPPGRAARQFRADAAAGRGGTGSQARRQPGALPPARGGGMSARPDDEAIERGATLRAIAPPQRARILVVGCLPDTDFRRKPGRARPREARRQACATERPRAALAARSASGRGSSS